MLTWRLAGINNQNFLARDEETGSFWQQITGKAVSGPLAGKQLELVHSDELTFGLWRQENPNGTVLKPVAKFSSEYEEKDWEKQMQRARTVVDTRKTGRKPRELLIGVETGGASKAFVLENVLGQKLIQDRIGSQAAILVVGPDDKSVRVFSARLPGSDVAEFYRLTDSKPGSGKPLMTDSVTGSGWNFEGCAIEGPARGECLEPIPALKDYWFDWHIYHPNTTVFPK